MSSIIEWTERKYNGLIIAANTLEQSQDII